MRTMSSLVLRLLGEGSLQVEGQPVHSLARKEFWLLAYLTLQQGIPVRRETLASLFWPDTEDDKARYNVRRALSHLRNALGDEAFRLTAPTPQTLCLDLSGDVFCDVLAFDAASTPREKAALYTGPLLPDCYDDWVLPERDRREQAHRQAVTAAGPRGKKNLPTPLTDLIGRTQEISEICGWLCHSRIITLFGTGGAGKTRLAIAAAATVLERFEDGVQFLDFSSLEVGGDTLDWNVLKLLGIPESRNEEPLETLVRAFAEKSILLILDNCEHVLDAAASLALALLLQCPQLKILATSRQALGLSGERVFLVPSLTLPPEEPDKIRRQAVSHEKDPNALLVFSAVRLFVERATQASPQFRLGRSNIEAIVTICRRLDGLPLALEMAATKTRSQSVSEIAAQLEARLDTLRAGNRAVPARQQTLQAAIVWSYDTLSEEERRAFRAVSVFKGGFTGAAAEFVCPGAWEQLGSLVEKSLAVFTPGGDADEENRFGQLQTLQQFGEERRERYSEGDTLKARHLDFYHKHCLESVPRQGGEEMLSEYAWIEREYDNIRAALAFGTSRSDEATQQKALALAGSLRRFWITRVYLADGEKWCRAVLALPGCQRTTFAQGQCQLALGMLLHLRGAHDEAKALMECCLARQKESDEALNVSLALGIMAAIASGEGDAATALGYEQECFAYAQKSGNPVQLTMATLNLGIAYRNLGDHPRGQELVESALALARSLGNRTYTAYSLGMLGDLAELRGDFQTACDFGRESLRVSQEGGDDRAIAIALNYMGVFLKAAGKLSESRHYRVESLLLSQKLGIQEQCTSVIGNIAELDGAEQKFERAARLWGAGTALRKKHRVFSYSNEEQLALVRTSLGDATFERLFAEGANLTLSEAIALAIH
jgi:predicted ATPase